MKIALITGSRSDRNAIEMVEKALSERGHKIMCVGINDPSQGIPEVAMMSAMSAVRVMCGDPWTQHVDLAVIHGDRHEIAAAALSLNVGRIPIAHIGGGDITEGSQDDCFRHAITKLSHLHFVSHQQAAERVLQMGEEKDRVHVTGCPGIDMVIATETKNRYQTFRDVGLSDGPITPQKCILVLFHSNTLGDTRPELEALSAALARRTEALVLLGPNADAGANLIRNEWKHLAAKRPDTVYHDNVEPALFYSLLKWCDMLIGNSSAAYYEAPCFGIHAMDIGDRQKGRPTPHNAWTRSYATDDPNIIHADIENWMTVNRGGRHENVVNPYGDGHAAERIAEIIGGITDPKALLRKRFVDIDSEG